MLFNSPEFIVFFVLVYLVYVALPFRLQNIMLLVASYIFYGWWDARFLFLVALSTTVDFWVGLMLDNGRTQPQTAGVTRSVPDDLGCGVSSSQARRHLHFEVFQKCFFTTRSV